MGFFNPDTNFSTVKTLFVMCGLPGSGKSTYLKEHISKLSGSVIVSRDDIRFSFIHKPSEYFAYEDQVQQIFWDKINEALAAGNNVYADQTSLTKNARKKLIRNVKGYDRLIAIWIDTDFSTCFERNKQREGLARVPSDVLRSMNKKFQPPSLNEGFDIVFRYDTVNNKKWVEFQQPLEI